LSISELGKGKRKYQPLDGKLRAGKLGTQRRGELPMKQRNRRPLMGVSS